MKPRRTNGPILLYSITMPLGEYSEKQIDCAVFHKLQGKKLKLSQNQSNL